MLSFLAEFRETLLIEVYNLPDCKAALRSLNFILSFGWRAMHSLIILFENYVAPSGQ